MKITAKTVYVVASYTLAIAGMYFYAIVQDRPTGAMGMALAAWFLARSEKV